MTDIELKPCPFCGGTNLKTGGDDKIVGVWCLTCQAAGPNHYGSREWNDRADFDARIRSAIERKAEPVANAMAFFAENVDRWGAAEWFDRLAKAIREQDKAVVAGDDISLETYRMIAASSAMTLVRDHEATVRAALSASPSPVDSRELIERLVKALEEIAASRRMNCHEMSDEERAEYWSALALRYRSIASKALAAKEQQPSPLPPSPKPAVVSEGGEDE